MAPWSRAVTGPYRPALRRMKSPVSSRMLGGEFAAVTTPGLPPKCPVLYRALVRYYSPSTHTSSIRMLRKYKASTRVVTTSMKIRPLDL